MSAQTFLTLRHHQQLGTGYPTSGAYGSFQQNGNTHSTFSRIDDAIAAQADFPPDAADILVVHHYLTVGEWRVMRDW